MAKLTKYHLAEPQQRNPSLTMAFCGTLITDDALAWAVDAVTCARCYRKMTDFKDTVPTKIGYLFRAITRAEDSLRWAEKRLSESQNAFIAAGKAVEDAYAAVPGWTPELQEQFSA